MSGAAHPPLPPYRAPRRPLVWAFERYFRRLFRRHFASVRWHGDTDPRAWDRAVPTLFVANHTNWWDGFLSFCLTRHVGLGVHVVMEKVNLDRYPPFRWIGTVQMRRDSLKGAWQDLMDARTCLRPATALWVYPQGQRRPAGEPPTRLERGAATLALATPWPVRVCAVGFRYVHTSEQLPEAFAWFGAPWLVEPGGRADRQALGERIGSALGEAVARLDARLAAERLDDFAVLVAGRLSINKRVDQLRHRAGLLAGPFEARNG